MSILQEALLEASQIKEAAKQQAEREIIEKHSKELKKRVEGILSENFNSFMREADEEEEDPMADLGSELDMGGDMGLDAGGGDDFEDDVEYVDDSDLSGMDSQIPYSFAGGEKMCPCPEDDEEIEIDFDELMSMADKDGEPSQDEFGSHDDLMGDMGAAPAEDDEMDLREFDIDEMLREFLGDEEAEAEEDDEEEVMEDLDVDVSPRPSGWSPRNEPEFKDEKVKQGIVAKHGKDKVKEKEGALSGNPPEEKEDKYKKMYEDLMARLNESKVAATANNKKVVLLQKTNTKYKELLSESVEQLEGVLLENTILKYQKKVLSNDSLNERQKSKYVDAIDNAKTVEDVKKVYSIIDGGLPSSGNKTAQEKKNAIQEAMRKRPQHNQQYGTKSDSKAEGQEKVNVMPESWLKIINKKL